MYQSRTTQSSQKIIRITCKINHIKMKFPKSKHVIDCYGGDLVTLRQGGVENKVLIILMEYCPNGTLFDLLEKK